jgi:hypothetical protein
MKLKITDVHKEVYPHGGRARINGWDRLEDEDTGIICEGYPNFVESMRNVIEESNDKKEKWISWLKEYGIKAAHPDDGFHKRKEHYFSFSYPYFDEGVEIDDKVALGDYDEFVVKKVIDIKKQFYGGKKYYYK